LLLAIAACIFTLVQSVSIVGIGRAGGALAIALNRAGIRIDKLIYRSHPPALHGVDPQKLAVLRTIEAIESDILLIATADQDIRSTAENLARIEKPPPIALHLSGSLSSDELVSLRDMNVAVGSLHPLVSISDPERGPERFSGA